MSVKKTVWVRDCRKFFRNENADPIFGDAVGITIYNEKPLHADDFLKCTLTYNDDNNKKTK